MPQAPSEHDEHLGSVDDFAPERPAAQTRPADLESAVLWAADTWRESKRARSWAVGTVVLLVVGVVGLVWWAIRPAASGETAAELIASSRVERQPIELPGISATLPSSSDSDGAVPVLRDADPVEKTQAARVTSTSRNTADRQSPAASSAADGSQVSPPMPRPAAASEPSSLVPPQINKEEPPARAAVSEPPPQPASAKATPRLSSGETTWGVARSAGEDASVAIQDVLGRYRTAYAALDVASVRQVWPGVNQRSLERAFRQLEGQEVSFFSCTIDVDGAGAQAACVGTTNFIAKVGNRSPQSGPSQWNFKLSRGSAGVWLIEDVQAR